ncbi:hypothetical protein KFE25_012959 [Diacronema lutheri]|uniref:Uncharacterized protein n=1 Tax=Diacronema lutheri TaxID=2081491 RepID=A0A8J5X5C8_DIALT|nr:hypothetical protein KFE25_012959 [Diacronema lutheri]
MDAIARPTRAAALAVPVELAASAMRSEREAMVVLGIAFDGIRMVAAADALADSARRLAAVSRALAHARAASRSCPSATAVEALLLHALDGGFRRTDAVCAQLGASAERVCRGASSAETSAELNGAHAQQLADSGLGSHAAAAARAATLEAVLAARALDAAELALAGVRALQSARAVPAADALARVLDAAAELLAGERTVGAAREGEATRGCAWAQVIARPPPPPRSPNAANAAARGSAQPRSPCASADSLREMAARIARAPLERRAAAVYAHGVGWDAHGGALAAVAPFAGAQPSSRRLAPGAAAALAAAAARPPGEADGALGAPAREQAEHDGALPPARAAAAECGGGGDDDARKRSRAVGAGDHATAECRPQGPNALASSSESPRAAATGSDDPISTVTPTPPSACKAARRA